MGTFNDVEYVATSILLEVMNRYGITYTKVQIKEICENFADLKKKEVFLIDKSDNELDEILFDLLTDGIDAKSRKKSGTERTQPSSICNKNISALDTRSAK